MFFVRNALSCALVLGVGLRSVQSREITGQASPGNFILHQDDDTNLSYNGASVSINSNVPVTVQRYYDDMQYVEGEQPVMSNEAKVLVTSDCAATTYVPVVTFGADSIDVNVEGALGGVEMPFLSSSSYHAKWDYTSGWCKSRGPPSSSTTTTILSNIMALFQRATWTKETERKEEEARNLASISSSVCNVNVEVMLDGCVHGMDVSAPKVRVKDASVKNASSRQSPKDECTYNLEADIMFQGRAKTRGTESLQVPKLDDGNFQGCMRAVPGRPFVDSTGSKVQASPLIVPTTVVGEVKVPSECESDVSSCPMESYQVTNNRTAEPARSDSEVSRNQRLLGEEWTRNAIGEHASVASFAAFSIALMTNGAPADLLEDSLKAALDEVRHAEISFEIASRLTGREVRPGPLPESAHAFGRDVKSLALAAAREGCVDETLSALEAAAEARLVDAALANGAAAGSKYAGVDGDVLAWIRDELRAIASEEGGHAALAWRTVEWACEVDRDACDLVKDRVLNEDELDRAFRRRFGSGASAVVEEGWRNIYSRVNGDSLVSEVVRKEIHGIIHP